MNTPDTVKEKKSLTRNQQPIQNENFSKQIPSLSFQYHQYEDSPWVL